jgi:hypothetical protein
MEKSKKRANVKRKEVNFEVGNLVFAHLRKERFPKREYNKLKLKSPWCRAIGEGVCC